MDAIISGEGEGPVEPIPKKFGYILSSESPASIDAVAAKMMGYNISRLHGIYNALYNINSKFNSHIIYKLLIYIKYSKN